MNATGFLFIILLIVIFVLILFLIYYSFFNDSDSWKDRAIAEEKELRQSLLIVKSIDQFNHWIFKYNDKDFVDNYQNDYTGSVSKDRLASLKLYDQFIDLGESFFTIRKGIFNLPTSFFSTLSLEAENEVKKIEDQKKLLLEALKRKHISSTEAILTVRKSMKRYYNLILIPLTDIANLDITIIESDNIQSEMQISLERERLKTYILDLSKINDKRLKRMHKRKIHDSKKIIKKEQLQIKNRNKDIKLRKYLIKHGNIQRTARDYLNYIQEIKTPYSTEEIELLRNKIK